MALDEALTRHGQPEIFNTDQGSQFTGLAFTGCLQADGVRISMDGRGRCLDNILIERLRRSIKYEAVYLHDLPDGFEAPLGTRWEKTPSEERCCMDRGGDGIRPFPSGSVRPCVGTQAVRVRSLCSGLSGRVGSP